MFQLYHSTFFFWSFDILKIIWVFNHQRFFSCIIQPLWQLPSLWTSLESSSHLRLVSCEDKYWKFENEKINISYFFENSSETEKINLFCFYWKFKSENKIINLFHFYQKFKKWKGKNKFVSLLLKVKKVNIKKNKSLSPLRANIESEKKWNWKNKSFRFYWKFEKWKWKNKSLSLLLKVGKVKMKKKSLSLLLKVLKVIMRKNLLNFYWKFQ